MLLKTREKRTKELFIKDANGKVTQYYKTTVHGGEENKKKNNLEAETSDLGLISNLSSSTEVKQETIERNLRRSNRLTKTNPIVILKNPVPSDYRKYRKQTKRPEVNGNRGKHSGKHSAAPNTEQHRRRTSPGGTNQPDN